MQALVSYQDDHVFLLAPAGLLGTSAGTLGQYTVAYTTTKAGEYNVTVGVNGSATASSPMLLEIQPDVTDSASCTAEGQAVTRTVAGEEPAIKLVARDRHGNARLVSDGNAFNVTMQGPSGHTPFCVLLCAARTLNATGQSRVTLSLR